MYNFIYSADKIKRIIPDMVINKIILFSGRFLNFLSVKYIFILNTLLLDEKCMHWAQRLRGNGFVISCF